MARRSASVAGAARDACRTIGWSSNGIAARVGELIPTRARRRDLARAQQFPRHSQFGRRPGQHPSKRRSVGRDDDGAWRRRPHPRVIERIAAGRLRRAAGVGQRSAQDHRVLRALRRPARRHHQVDDAALAAHAARSYDRRWRPRDSAAVEPGVIDGEWRLYRAVGQRRQGADRGDARRARRACGRGVRSESVNLKFFFEGEEEAGSPHTCGDARAQRVAPRGRRVALRATGRCTRSRRPQIVFGARGVTGAEITVYGPSRRAAQRPLRQLGAESGRRSSPTSRQHAERRWAHSDSTFLRRRRPLTRGRPSRDRRHSADRLVAAGGGRARTRPKRTMRPSPNGSCCRRSICAGFRVVASAPRRRTPFRRPPPHRSTFGSCRTRRRRACARWSRRIYGRRDSSSSTTSRRSTSAWRTRAWRR